MTVATRKICIVGDFAVGKTSVAERFVNNHFSDKYLTTVGVKIDTKEVLLEEQGVLIKLVIWDVAGTEEFGAREFAYLRGASGIVYVADGTRAPTLKSAKNLKMQIEEKYGCEPSVLLLNKIDLAGMWEIGDDVIEALADDFDEIYRTSAKTGNAVEEALTALTRRIVAADLQRQQ